MPRLARDCPACGAPIQPTDAQCMECGVDLAEARAKLERQAVEGVRLTSSAARAHRGATSAHGVAEVGESSEATRMRVFDRHLAEQLRGERMVAYVTSGLSALVTAALASLGLGLVRSGGGLAGLRQLSPKYVRELGWSLFGDDSLLGAWLVAMAVAALLCVIGQTLRGIAATRSIREVDEGHKPEIVGIASTTQAGVMLFALLCPVLGLPAGIALKLGHDDQTKSLGSITIWLSVIALAFIALNYVWALGAQLLQRGAPPPGAAGSAGVLAPFVAPRGWSRLPR